jgi:predicted DNA-binding protein (MmcQ/YjbR family)
LRTDEALRGLQGRDAVFTKSSVAKQCLLDNDAGSRVPIPNRLKSVARLCIPKVMTPDQFNDICSDLPATTNVIQWGNASVWKVGGKIFAICSSWGSAGDQRINFKCSDLAYSLLIQEDGIIPAPYLARAKWVRVERQDALSDDDIKAYITAAHSLISAKLTRKQRIELGLPEPS